MANLSHEGVSHVTDIRCPGSGGRMGMGTTPTGYRLYNAHELLMAILEKRAPRSRDEQRQAQLQSAIAKVSPQHT
jgi:hypothetical protein